MDYGATTSVSKTQWTSHRSRKFRKRKLGNRKSFVTPLLLIAVLFSLFYFFSTQNAQAHHILTEVLDVTLQPTATPTPTPSPVQTYNTAEIEEYIRTIFGPDADVAVAIARAESELNPTAKLQTAYEISIGIFQINIESSFAKVHWDRIPGKTLQEKITWLENPYNNTLMAYWIFKTDSSWLAWSAFINGTYQQYL